MSYLPPETNPPERLSSRTHLAETCPACKGEGFLMVTLIVGAFASERCRTCKGAGRLIRPTHSPESEVGGPSDDEFKIAQLETQLGVMRGQLEATEAERARWERGARELLERASALLDAARKAKEALDHVVDLGPPCPACRAEDQDVEDMGGYPHHEDCLALAALSALSAVLGDTPKQPLEKLEELDRRALAERVREAAASAAAAEPELPGEPEPGMREALRTRPEEVARACVSVTKRNIEERIRSLDLDAILGGGR